MSDIKAFVKEAMARHNARSLAGLTLRNAAGDIDQSGLGFQIAIDTLTYIKKQVTEQKFYEVPFADFIPVSVGDGAFAQSILTNMVVSTAGDFEQGVINTGSHNDRVAIADAGVVSKTMAVINWAKAVGYSIIEIEQALQANNWDLIESKHRARKKNWDLGLQKIAFLGMLGGGVKVPGLLTQSVVNSDTSTITKTISSMSTAEFSTFVAAVIAAYQANCNYTAMPNAFLIPQDDYLGLATPLNTTYPTVSKLEYLKKAFAEIVPGGVDISPIVYGIPAYNTAFSVNKHRYTLYRKDPETLRLDIPVDFTVTQPNTLNNFQFQDVAYGQFTGVGVYRPLEVLYFDF